MMRQLKIQVLVFPPESYPQNELKKNLQMTQYEKHFISVAKKGKFVKF
jgi:hypothetical protein